MKCHLQKFANGNKTSEIPSYVDIIMKTTPIATGELISEDSFDSKQLGSYLQTKPPRRRSMNQLNLNHRLNLEIDLKVMSILLTSQNTLQMMEGCHRNSTPTNSCLI